MPVLLCDVTPTEARAQAQPDYGHAAWLFTMRLWLAALVAVVAQWLSE